MQAFQFIFLNLFLYVSSLSHFSQSYSFSRQTSDDDLALFGDAFFVSDQNHSVSLTQELPSCRFPSSSDSTSTTTTEFFPFPDNGNGVGRVMYGRPIQFLDPTTNTTSSFSSTFSFSIVPSLLCSAGDGLAFLISPDAIPDSGAGAKGRIGLPGPPFATFFAVEFDTSFDPLLSDSGANHVGLDLDAPVSAASADLTQLGIDLRGGREITAWVEYRGPASLFRVWLAYSPEPRPRNPVLVAELDLSDRFEDSMYVGFSGSNGHGSSLHVINTWKFKTFDHRSALLLPMDDFLEGDCFICSHELPQTSNSTNSIDTGKNDPLIISPPRNVRVLGDMILGIGGFVAFVVSILAITGVAGFLAIKRKRKLRRLTRVEISASQQHRTKAVPARLSQAEIWAATMGFDRSRIVGVGASATVYKGSLPLGGGEVAIKRFRDADEVASLSSGRSRRPFDNEFATMVNCLRHKNLIQLQGWCCEGSELALVYEYMPNGSLDDILHGPETAELSCRRRLNITVGVASALAYLHEDCQRQVVHRDVKACNIMLDSDFNPKLGDFGLAVAEVSGGVSGKAPAGTVGYLAPEYVCSGVASTKTDVYSFGVVVLEVGTGRRAVEEDGVSVVDWAWGLWERGRLGEAVDPRLKGRDGEREVERMLHIGLACVHPNHLKRPTAREAVRVLKGEVPLPALPARKPRLQLRSLVPDVFEEVPSPDNDPFLTPRSEFL